MAAPSHDDDCHSSELGMLTQINEGEGVQLRGGRGLLDKEGDETLGRIVAIAPLDKAVHVTDIPQGIDLDVGGTIDSPDWIGLCLRCSWLRLNSSCERNARGCKFQ